MVAVAAGAATITHHARVVVVGWVVVALVERALRVLRALRIRVVAVVAVVIPELPVTAGAEMADRVLLLLDINTILVFLYLSCYRVVNCGLTQMTDLKIAQVIHRHLAGL